VRDRRGRGDLAVGESEPATAPTARPMSAWPCSVPASTRRLISAKSRSVPASSSRRAGAVGGHQRAAADDQPLAGIQLSQAISARLSSSNTDNCKAPSLTSFLTCGAFSAVMNANSAVSENSVTFSVVPIPRSVTTITRESPNRCSSSRTCEGSVLASFSEPSNASIASRPSATRRPQQAGALGREPSSRRRSPPTTSLRLTGAWGPRRGLGPGWARSARPTPTRTGSPRPPGAGEGQIAESEVAPSTGRRQAPTSQQNGPESSSIQSVPTPSRDMSLACALAGHHAVIGSIWDASDVRGWCADPMSLGWFVRQPRLRAEAG
jgi:hypothetical protein